MVLIACLPILPTPYRMDASACTICAGIAIGQFYWAFTETQCEWTMSYTTAALKVLVLETTSRMTGRYRLLMTMEVSVTFLFCVPAYDLSLLAFGSYFGGRIACIAFRTPVHEDQRSNSEDANGF